MSFTKVIEDGIIVPIKRMVHRVYFNNMSDKKYLEFQWRRRMGGSINWDNPKTFCEKIQWTKLFYHNPLLTSLVDKYEVKKIVSKKIGEQYVIPCIGVWDRAEDIDISTLPNQFVLKCTHDSGSIVICKNKSTFNLKAAKKKLAKALKSDYYIIWREWAYKNVRRRIVAEPYIDTLGSPESVEYKLTCFDGKVRVITVCEGVAHAELSQRTNDHYDRDWNKQDWWAFYRPSGKDWKKPAQMDDIIAFSEKLSEGLPQVRVDWYVVGGKPVFGEMTFYTWFGMIDFEPASWDNVMGEWFKLPAKQI